MATPSREIQLLSLLESEPITALLGASPGEVRLLVSDKYLADSRLADSAAEMLALQRLLTIAKACERLSIVWESTVARRVLSSPAIHPLAALTLCLRNAAHMFPAGVASDARSAHASARKALLGHRLKIDLFSDSQILLCVDHESPSAPPDLFSQADGTLLGDDQLEALVDDIFVHQRATAPAQAPIATFRLSLAVLVRELLENTQDHGRVDLERNPVRPNGLRGLVVKRVTQPLLLPGREVALSKVPSAIECLELTVFDSGIGYYESFRRQPLTAQTSISEEWRVLHNCLRRHFDDSIPDARPGYRGMGLYEVLRALQRLQGLFEVRTGRLHAYRTFLPGELQFELEGEDSSRPGRPKPVLMDFQNPVVRKPSLEEQVVGSLVRVVVPLL